MDLENTPKGYQFTNKGEGAMRNQNVEDDEIQLPGGHKNRNKNNPYQPTANRTKGGTQRKIDKSSKDQGKGSSRLGAQQRTPSAEQTQGQGQYKEVNQTTGSQEPTSGKQMDAEDDADLFDVEEKNSGSGFKEDVEEPDDNIGNKQY